MFLAFTRICQEDEAPAYVEKIVQTVLIETERKSTWRGQLMGKLHEWLGEEGSEMWMRPRGSVRLEWSSIDAEVLCVQQRVTSAACVYVLQTGLRAV